MQRHPGSKPKLADSSHDFPSALLESKFTKLTIQNLTSRLQKASHKHVASEAASPRLQPATSSTLKPSSRVAAVKGTALASKKTIPMLSLTKLSPNASGRSNQVATIRPCQPSSKTTSENQSLNNSASIAALNSTHAPQSLNTSQVRKSIAPQSTRNVSKKEFEFTSRTLLSAKSLKSPKKPEPAEPPKETAETVKMPVTAATALRLFSDQLTPYEQGEILDHQEVFFLGLKAQKIRQPGPNAINFGYDDDRGDYKIVLGDHIAYRYEVLEILGKGSFGQVIKVLDYKTQELLALKIIRNKSRFHHQAVVEVKILRYLRDKDTRNEFNVIHLRDYFVFRKHLCITFEMLTINLYDFIKSNNFQGLSMALIRRFAVQLLTCLKALRKLRVIHCDLKPENILLKQQHKSGIKVIDFGSSCFEEERVYTYIQSRFYRAPEIILGISYTTAIDMWSLGCILAELYTGLPLFPGESEHEQILCIMEIKGVPPPEVMEAATRKKMFFDSTGEPKIIANRRGKKRYPNTRTLSEALRCSDESFLDFLQRKHHTDCFEWDAKKRMTPDQALMHEWLTEGLTSAFTVTTPHATSRSGSSQPHQSRAGVSKAAHKHKLSLAETSSVLQSAVSQFLHKHQTSTKAADPQSFLFS